MKHISSFIGNVGDVLSNHAFSNYLHERGYLSYEKIEIRDFYKNVPKHRRRCFDEIFRECQIKGETLIIGGGGFLDYWVDSSRTATTIDVDLDLVLNTSFKLIISSIGSFPHKYVSPENLKKFIHFMTLLSTRENTFVMLRNDGSYDELKNVLPESVFNSLYKGADNAYLAERAFKEYEKIDGSYVVFNVAPDQLKMNSKYRDSVDIEHFKRQIVSSITSVITQLGKKVVLVPHLLSDVRFYVELCEELDDLLVRESVKIFTYSGQDIDLKHYTDVYSNSFANVCTRLHSNVFSALLNKKTVSLCVLDRVREIASQHDNLYSVTDFSSAFSEQIISILNARSAIENKTSYYDVLENFYSEVL